jgi:VRR-NUC domain-containing protein
MKIPVPTEAAEQRSFIKWCRVQLDVRYPGIKLIFAVPNGAWMKSPRQAVSQKRGGLLPGIPDLFLPVPRGTYHGLFIEMKRIKGAKPSPLQLDTIAALAMQGYWCVVAYGAREAIGLIERYYSFPEDRG